MNLKNLDKNAEKQIKKLEDYAAKLDAKIKHLFAELNKTSSYIELYKKAAGQSVVKVEEPTQDNSAEQPVKFEVVSPLSDEGIAIGRALPLEFYAKDIIDRVVAAGKPQPPQPHSWLTSWKNKDWVEPLGGGRYKKKQCFGVR